MNEHGGQQDRDDVRVTPVGAGRWRTPSVCGPCVAQLTSPVERLTALCARIATETEPVVTVTHLLQLCRDEHAVLWEQVSDPDCQDRVASALGPLRKLLGDASPVPTLDGGIRGCLADTLESTTDVPPVVVAYSLAQLLDDRYAHTFTRFFRERSPYQPAVGDPVPLDFPNLRQLTAMPFTAPPWRLANRLDQTRHIRLAGAWAVQFRVVFDYSLADALAGFITAETLIATCHPNRSLDDFALPRNAHGRTFPIRPIDLDRQRAEINRLIGAATAAGADIVVLPELCVTETLAAECQAWVQRPDGPRLLVVGSYHHDDRHDDTAAVPRRRNTAMGWARGHDIPFTHDKHSPADAPIAEDIRPQGWPELRVHVIDGWHLVIAVCRDLLNPEAVHALTEVGANLVLVPAMSETLLAFGGQGANLVGSCQAIVAVANNPGEWPSVGKPPGRPARALFGHPGLNEQTIAVHSAEPDPGIALLAVRSAEVTWLSPGRQSTEADSLAHDQSCPTNDRASIALPATVAHGANPATAHTPSEWKAGPPIRHPAWLQPVVERVQHVPSDPWPSSRTLLRAAAVLVLLIDSPEGPLLLLSERAPTLRTKPGTLVFPGGAAEVSDDGPIATALREAWEEAGVDPATVHIVGILPPLPVPVDGFLVTAIVGWCERLTRSNCPDPAEVAAIVTVPLRALAHRSSPAEFVEAVSASATPLSIDGTPVGAITTALIDWLFGGSRRATGVSPR